MKCWTRPNHLTLVQPGTRPGLFGFLACERSAVQVCTSISVTKAWERAKNKWVRNWSLSKAMGKAPLVEKQLGQLWWKGQCGVGVRVMLGTAKAGRCFEELLPSLCSGWAPCLGLWNGSWKLGVLQSLALAEPPRRETGKKAEWNVTGEWVCVCKNLYMYIHTYGKKKRHDFDMTSTNVSIMYLELPTMSLPDLQGEYLSQPEAEKSRAVSFQLSGAYFSSSPRGNVEHFLIIQVCKWEALRVHYISLFSWLQLPYRIIFSAVVFNLWSLFL